MSNDVNRLLEFGGFRVDLRKGILQQGGRAIPVPPKAFDTLIALIESDGVIVSKEELMARVWGETFVEENNLTQQISLLRKVLQDSDQKMIETVPRRGYRFAAEVQELVDEDSEPISWPRRRALIAASSVIAVLIAVAVIQILQRSRNNLPRTIAVLPFKPLVGKQGDVYLELGMADALITELSNVRAIRVRPTSSVLAYTNAADAVAVGEKLGVEAVLDGRIQRVGDRVRVTAQLIRVSNGTPLWAAKFDEDADNILSVQDAMSRRIAAALMVDLTGAEQRSLSKRTTDNAEAYQLYLRGRYYWYQWTPEGWERGRDAFEQAVAKDPKFALAWSGLADSIGVQLWYRPPKEIAPRARAAAERALALDDTLADPYVSLGPLALFYDFDRATAERHLKRAIELNPNHALAHDLYALLLATSHRFPEALAESRRALALDPTSPYMNTDLGVMYYFQHDYARAEEHVRAALALAPRYADGLRYLSAIQEQRKEYGAAIENAAKLLDETGDTEIATAVRASFAASGYEAALRTWVDGLLQKSKRTYVTPLDLAEVYARLGDREQVFTWLAKARDEHSPGIVWIPVEPRWDPYREDPRMKRMLRELRLE